jgi:hypothetical protein
VKAFIRNITFIICFLLAFSGVVGVIYACNSSISYQAKSSIFLFIFLGFIAAILVVSFISGILEEIVRDYNSNRIRNHQVTPSLTRNPSRRDSLLRGLDNHRQWRNLDDVYSMWPLRIGFPDSPWRVEGVSDDLVFRLNLSRINHIVREVISDLKNKEQGG